MPKFSFTNTDVPRFELLKPEFYPFEVIDFETGVQNSGRVNGCEYVGIKLRWFAPTDRDFKKPIAQWSERLTFPQTSDKDLNEFLNAQLNMFVKCTNMSAKPGEEIELGRNVIGLRGIAKVKQRLKDKNDKSPNAERVNQVDFFATDKEKFAQVVIELPEDDKPF